MTRAIQFHWMKTFILPDDQYGDKDITKCDHSLHGALQNFIYLAGVGFGKQIPVTVYKQHNRDIYYMTVGEMTDVRKLDPCHLDEWEQDNIVKTTITEVLDRCRHKPHWWNPAWQELDTVVANTEQVVDHKPWLLIAKDGPQCPAHRCTTKLAEYKNKCNWNGCPYTCYDGDDGFF